jgi:hypothetical protein
VTVLTGHVDGISIQGRVARILDHKTGRKDSDYRQQALGYCALALLENADLEESTCTVLWIRDLEVEEHRMTRAELEPWIRTLLQQVVDWDGVWRPGPHCDHCKRMHDCPARNARMRADIAIVTDRNLVGHIEDGETLATWTNEAKIDLVEKARVASKLIERVLDALKADVITNGGEISDGKRRLTIVTEPRRYLDPIKAFPVLAQAGFTDEDMAAVIEMTAAKAENVVAERAPKGKAAAAKRELTKALEAAGAVQVREIQKMIQRRA